MPRWMRCPTSTRATRRRACGRRPRRWWRRRRGGTPRPRTT
uniref:Putative breast carcinoma amplified sequence 2 n=1 Tax=Taeniopygia guttata TaxID=59729 RepID=B5G471_TAEGU|nr:putative breast carcinoma amplified sequence 2 [Taeniopygia guttata]